GRALRPDYGPLVRCSPRPLPAIGTAPTPYESPTIRPELWRGKGCSRQAIRNRPGRPPDRTGRSSYLGRDCCSDCQLSPSCPPSLIGDGGGSPGDPATGESKLIVCLAGVFDQSQTNAQEVPFWPTANSPLRRLDLIFPIKPLSL